MPFTFFQISTFFCKKATPWSPLWRTLHVTVLDTKTNVYCSPLTPLAVAPPLLFLFLFLFFLLFAPGCSMFLAHASHFSLSCSFLGNPRLCQKQNTTKQRNRKNNIISDRNRRIGCIVELHPLMLSQVVSCSCHVVSLLCCDCLTYYAIRFVESSAV